MSVTASLPGGVVVVDGSKVVVASTDEIEQKVTAALRRPFIVVQGDPRIVKGAIVEGELRKLRRGTAEYDRATLAALDDAVIVD